MRLILFNRFIIFFFVLMISFIAYLQYTVAQSTEMLKSQEIHKSEQYAGNIADFITRKIPSDIAQTLKEEQALREQMNEMLEMFLVPKYEYIFLLSRDKRGHYRFLLDGSKEDKEEFGTLFFPGSRQFDQVYANQKGMIVRQKDEVKGVWLSLMYPIVREGHTEALLVLDLSKWYGEHIENFNSPVSDQVLMIQIFLVLSFLLILLVSYLYYRYRQKILYDQRTGAYSKLYLEEFFNRHKVDAYDAMLIDIDEFKEINRSYGYEKGDILLGMFVKTLEEELPVESSIVMMGGAEFFVFFKKGEDIEVCARTLHEVLRHKQYLVDNEVVLMRSSISAIVTPEDTPDIQHVLRILDEGLLKVKSRGKNGYFVIDAQSSNDLRYQNIDFVKKALRDERLLCLFQPIYDTQTGTIRKYEALVRLVDDKNPVMLIPPSKFISLIQRTSHYIRMSRLVLRGVFKKLSLYKEIEISLNLDLEDLYNIEMMTMIVEFLEESREEASRLTFEIVEQEEILDFIKVNAIFRQLRAYGSKIAIDDFGSGYSNYTYLMKLDIDILKIDGALVKELEANTERAGMVIRSIVTLAEQFGIEVVAEYVASEKIFKEVRALGITMAQGYYLSKPATLEKLLPSVE